MVLNQLTLPIRKQRPDENGSHLGMIEAKEEGV